MPIIERTPEKCFSVFRDHISKLVSATIPTDIPIGLLASADDKRKTLAFIQGHATTVPITTEYGQLHFYIAQLLGINALGKKTFQLETKKYWYRVQAEPGSQMNALLRWEYNSPGDTRVNANPCRNHVQLQASIAPPNSSAVGPFNLNKMHIPSGWVTIEELIRFLIVELGMIPKCGDSWPQVIHDSEETFFQRFSSKKQG